MLLHGERVADPRGVRGEDAAARLLQAAVGDIERMGGDRVHAGAARNQQVAARKADAVGEVAVLIFRFAPQLAAGDGNIRPDRFDAVGEGVAVLLAVHDAGAPSDGGQAAAGHGKSAALGQQKPDGEGAVGGACFAAGQLDLAALDRQRALRGKRGGVGPRVAGVAVRAGPHRERACRVVRSALNGQVAVRVNAVDVDFICLLSVLRHGGVAAEDAVVRPVGEHDGGSRGELHGGGCRGNKAEPLQRQRFGTGVPGRILGILPFCRVEQRNGCRAAVGRGKVRRFGRGRSLGLCCKDRGRQQRQTQGQNKKDTSDASFHSVLLFWSVRFGYARIAVRAWSMVRKAHHQKLSRVFI